MKISINPIIFEIEEDFKLGINHYTKFVVSESPQMLKGRMQLFQEHLFFDLQDRELTDYPGLKEWRVLWKKFGSDPGRYRPSMEAMMRRIRSQKYMQPLNSGVDLNNFFSLQYEIPIGLYDLNQINGDVEIVIGNADTSYMGLNGRDNQLKGILSTRDLDGPFGSPFVDSARSSVNEQTKDALQVFYLKPSMTIDEAQELLGAAGKMFVQVNGGDHTSIILNKQMAESYL